MRTLKSCGFIVTQGTPVKEFLLMVHEDRLDVPKGHIEKHETEMECALRELAEETAILAADVQIDPKFRFTISYQVRPKKLDYEVHEKTTVLFHARLIRDVEIRVTEHFGFQWRHWDPPHKIQSETIDPLLHELALYLQHGDST